MERKDKDEFDSLMRIAEFNIKQFNERREYSWKIALGFWGAIIGNLALLIPYRDSIPTWATFTFGILIILIHLFWLYGNFQADQKDKKLAFRLRDSALEKIKIKPSAFEGGRSFYCDWSAVFQIKVTIILVIIAIGILSLPIK